MRLSAFSGVGHPVVVLLVAGLISAVGLSFAMPASAQAAPKSTGGCKNGAAHPGQVSKGKAKRAVLCLLNKRRAARGMPKLRPQRQLKRAAQGHSKYMVSNNCFAHVCPDGPDVLRRLTSAGYLANRHRRSSWGYGENIAWGSGKLGSPAGMVRAWMRSEKHRENILRRDFRQIGIGVVWGSPQGETSLPAGTYTTDFGFRKG